MIKILFNIEILLYNDKNFHKLFYKEISKFKNYDFNKYLRIEYNSVNIMKCRKI